MDKKAGPKSRGGGNGTTATPNPDVHGSAPQRDSAEQGNLAVCTVVGFGASAGGLEALSEVLANMPLDPGTALVLVQHLDPHHESMLTQLLSRATALPVENVRDGIVPQANRVYVIPANYSMMLTDGALRLHPRGTGSTAMPIDVFFRSLAVAEGSKAVGVILSGTASDGTLGLKAIKAAGGITFCQDVDSAKYDGMPRSAIAAGCVDFVLPPRDIAQELVRLCRHPYVAKSSNKLESTAGELDFGGILSMLRTSTGVDFTFYKDATIRRRILRRVALNRLDSPESYLEFIRQNRGELHSLFQDILINVTEFFREPETFDALRTQVFPILCGNRKNDDPIRIWVPGCASGEEAYSVGICLLEYLQERSIDATIQIFGTDLSETALEKARAGLYSESIVNDVSPERLRKFFVKVNGHYQIARSVRDLCIFARQNLTKDPPFSKLDLVTCRNVLIYLGPILQNRLMRVFHYALKPNGFLALGISETAGSLDLFHPVDRKQKLYSRKNISATVSLDLSGYEDTPAPQNLHKTRLCARI
jgi:two-component system, chemotaxis family, CheB/CheR fusion protein